MTAVYTYRAEENQNSIGGWSACLFADGKRFARASSATYPGCVWLSPLSTEAEALAEAESRWSVITGTAAHVLVVRVDGEPYDRSDDAPSVTDFQRDIDLEHALDATRD